MKDVYVQRAAEMLLSGATMLAQPCPYCSGVRVIKDGKTLCVSCGSKPNQKTVTMTYTVEDLERQVLELTMRLGETTDPDNKKRILESITDISTQLATLKASYQE